MITHLSSPEGSSINDGIEQQFSNVSYASVEDAIKVVDWLFLEWKKSKFTGTMTQFSKA